MARDLFPAFFKVYADGSAQLKSDPQANLGGDQHDDRADGAVHGLIGDDG